jgi:hypothetical protein
MDTLPLAELFVADLLAAVMRFALKAPSFD